jgi:hypothetical protein
MKNFLNDLQKNVFQFGRQSLWTDIGTIVLCHQGIARQYIFVPDIVLKAL